MPVTKTKMERDKGGGFRTATWAPKQPNFSFRVGSGCGLIGFIMLTLLGVAVYISTICFDYCLWVVCGKDIPWYADMICGIIASEICCPLAIILYFLNVFGVITFPLIQ